MWPLDQHLNTPCAVTEALITLSFGVKNTSGVHTLRSWPVIHNNSTVEYIYVEHIKKKHNCDNSTAAYALEQRIVISPSFFRDTRNLLFDIAFFSHALSTY